MSPNDPTTFANMKHDCPVVQGIADSVRAAQWGVVTVRYYGAEGHRGIVFRGSVRSMDTPGHFVAIFDHNPGVRLMDAIDWGNITLKPITHSYPADDGQWCVQCRDENTEDCVMWPQEPRDQS
jgi:hypothetical protein